MAKLNDPPLPPTESIESLKRRFIRQNREIARVNSTQSQRIRNLETEISRLVAENISLREQAISAQAEAERWRATSSVNVEILDLRDRLNRKVEEVAEMLVEMGNLPEKAARKGRRKSRLLRTTMSSATEQEWRNRQSTRESFAQETGDLYDGRLPAIHEDKLYPRRTLENAELSALREEAALQQASESPELGPPPVAHFDVVSESLGLDSARISEDENVGEEVMQLPSLLERRRKRRTSTLIHDLPTEETPGPDAPSIRPSEQLLKSGAKRKLDVSDLDEPVLQQPSKENDDFVFQRRQEIWSNATVNSKKASRFTRPPGRESGDATELVKQPSPQKPTGATRKILAPKSTNSPAKRRVQVPEKLKDDRDLQEKHPIIKPTRQKEPQAHVVIDRLIGVPNDDDAEKDIPPKTPAGEAGDILSPVSTEPSTRTSHQTKEAAVLNSVEDVLNGSIGRGSRRPRPQISYAEPNLRDKMRRPGKGLVGAVEGIEKQRENASGNRGTSMDRAKSEDPGVQQEDEINGKDERWKGLAIQTSTARGKEEPFSPLRGKERKEKEHDETKKAGKQPKPNTEEELGNAVDRLSIFDPPLSSPADDSKETQTDTEGNKSSKSSAGARRKPLSSSTGTTRRHSMQPSASSGESAGLHSASRQLSYDALKSDTQAPLPRPSSAASLRGDGASRSRTSAVKDLKRSHSVSSSLKDKEPATSGAETGLATSRVERALNRRRSMMV
ncbi:uncharacterized protein PV07_08959 [Cladophialophora immunda]|uniref:Shugoshin C-terminal domain-containing protein n=1 Tax=Cladophialophora immunda TaxID=569365 RepID=A0A0D1ZDH9_9EURO|nr:uncharacterized protein PV07_08959 [Cladophialophora immunda]KIW25816.1 hypothetical protein PV07_08959 [Cladophialophora immunda]OQU96184.1 Shugoshin coiled-coil domain-containing protein [Cladophialophora immunda]